MECVVIFYADWEDPPPSIGCKVFVGNLTVDVLLDELYRVVSPIGNHTIFMNNSSRFRAYDFCFFFSILITFTAIYSLKENILLSNKLCVL